MKVSIAYRIEFIDKGMDDEKAVVLIDGKDVPQRVAEALAQGLREYGDFEAVTLTRMEYAEGPVGF